MTWSNHTMYQLFFDPQLFPHINKITIHIHRDGRGGVPKPLTDRLDISTL